MRKQPNRQLRERIIGEGTASLGRGSSDLIDKHVYQLLLLFTGFVFEYDDLDRLPSKDFITLLR